jgi:hypothetical protein
VNLERLFREMKEEGEMEEKTRKGIDAKRLQADTTDLEITEEMVDEIIASTP